MAETIGVPEEVMQGRQEWRYDFGKMPKSVARKMWRCDILTGELKRVDLQVEKRWEMTGNIKGVSSRKQIVNFYWIMTKSNYFYIHAKDIAEAKEKFEAEFAKADKQIKDKEGEQCLKKV